LRCYKAHTLWSNSLLHHACLWLLRYLTGCSFPLHLTLSFIGFWTVNLTLLAAFFYFFLNQSLLSATYVYLIPAVAFLGFNLWVFFLLWRNASENQKISQALYSMTDGDTSYKIDLMGFSGKELELAKTINNISVGLSTALQEQVKSERLKADLITNVSHDIKTPLTSIINYVDLIKREHIQDEKVQRYLEVLDQKSQRLKTLTEDLVEASKASSGNLKLEIARIDIVELIQQTNGEFEEKFALRHLEMVSHLPNQVIFIEADGRRLWRVLENLYNNAFKYAMEQSRVYIDITANDGWVSITIKNISENPLNINAGELTERFVRGDVARTTEGSGLGLSIAKSLTELQGGRFELYIDGDLFKAQISFPTLVIPTDY
ncbi:MAG: HAMP domain-containing sensor histidine kinase, partial [Hungatella sp.]